MMKRLFLLLSVFLLAGCVDVLLEEGGGTGDTAVSPASPVRVTPPTGQLAQVADVIDGDTIDVMINGETYRVRYIGVDTPERDEPFYREATEANRVMVDGQTVILVKDVSETDRYGRLLRYVYLQDGTFVNAELVRQGYARLVTFPPDVAMQDTFLALQQEARNEKRGLWQNEPLLPTNLPAICQSCSKNSYNCSDFSTQADAQACFDYCMAQTGEDVHKLDGGGDGIVCESLP
jgi:micrococcal nuclease